MFIYSHLFFWPSLLNLPYSNNVCGDRGLRKKLICGGKIIYAHDEGMNFYKTRSKRKCRVSRRAHYNFWWMKMYYLIANGIIRGHKGQNSAGTRCRGVIVPESRCRSVLVLDSRCRVYVPPRSCFCYHRESKRITHNYFNYVVEKYFNWPNLCNIYLYNVCISELE